jgi:hypothetical protein
VGNGLYPLNAIKAATDKDWFPDSELGLGGQIDEIRFVCALPLRNSIPVDTTTIFPSKSEALKGQRIRIEVPCTNDALGVRIDLKRTVEFFRQIWKAPNQTVDRTKQVIAACENNPKSYKCKLWKDYVSKIFSGQLQQELSGILASCDVKFKAGLNPLETFKVNDQSLFWDLDLKSPVLDDDDDRLGEFVDWIRKTLSKCTREWKTDGKECLDQALALRKTLTKEKKVVFNGDGTAQVAGELIGDCNRPKYYHDALKSFVSQLLCFEQERVRPGNIGSGESNDKALSNAADALRQKVLHVVGLDDLENNPLEFGRTDKSLLYPIQPLETCDLDFECIALRAAIRDHLTMYGYDAAPQVPCSRLVSITFDKKMDGKDGPLTGIPVFHWVPNPNGCKQN